MTKQATIISTRQPAGGEICFQFRDFSPGIPGLPMTDFYKALNMSQIQIRLYCHFSRSDPFGRRRMRRNLSQLEQISQSFLLQMTDL